MRKRCKSIVAAIMAVLMLASLLCTPAMAAEQTSVPCGGNLSADVLTEQENEGSAMPYGYPSWFPVNVIAEYSANRTLVNQPMWIGVRTFGSTVSGVSVILECNGSNSATVNFRIRNTSTGKNWTFSANVANSPVATVFPTNVPAGDYDIWVDSVTYEGAYYIQLLFCYPK